MSFFQKLLDHLPTVVQIEQTALSIAATAGHDISEGSIHAAKAAESAWKFVIANLPELENAASIIATATGNVEVVPAIKEAAIGAEVLNSVVNKLAEGHANISTLADSVSQLSAVVANNEKVNGGDQQAINVANQVSTTAAQVAIATAPKQPEATQ